MKWPWSKEPEPVVEKRESYTETLLSAIFGARSEGAAEIQQTAISEIAAGQLARTLSAAVLKPESDMLAKMITPDVLTMTGYALIKAGEIVFWISPTGVLVPSSYWNVIEGGYDSRTWVYQVDLAGPRSHSQVTVNSKEVLHFMFRRQAVLPYVGVGPLQGAALTSQLVSGLERMLSQESNAASGYLLPVPEFSDSEDDPAQALKTDLGKLAGRTTLIETSSNAYGEGRQAAPQRDFVPSRIGANPPGALVALREQAAMYLLSAAGYPPSLLTPGDGASKREMLRLFNSGFAASVARTICDELSRKLHVADCELVFSPISDIASRARAFGQLVAGGMDVEKATALSGLLLEDD